MMMRRAALAAICLARLPLLAQSGNADWQTAAGGHRSFDVASVKEANPGASPRLAGFPLTADDSWAQDGGHFSASLQLAVYIQFAYKLWLTRDQVETMLAHLPGWVATDCFDIQANATGNPTKDQMRMMMQALLAERFKLAFHVENRRGKVYALTLAKPGKTGPKLVRHELGPACDDQAPFFSGSSKPGDAFPPHCGVFSMAVTPGGGRVVGARNTTPELLATSLAFLGNLGRPVIDRTGLSGRYDFTIEFAPESTGVVQTEPGPDSTAPAFLQAVRDQLGMKLESTEGLVATPIIDHIEKPSAN